MDNTNNAIDKLNAWILKEVENRQFTSSKSVLEIVEEVERIVGALVKIGVLDEKNANEYISATRNNAYLALEKWEDE